MPTLSQIDIRENILRSKGRVLDILLCDMTTHKNIIWATDSYIRLGKDYKPKKPILKIQITGLNGKRIQPRASKSREEQIRRTKDKAEVFTPLDVVGKMNSIVKHSLNLQSKNTWQDDIKSIWLEITCGEAPFITGRYNPTSSSQIIIKPKNRVGFLDKKLQLINKHTANKEDWLSHAEIALKSCYGYEWQGDNLLIARENILLTTNDFFSEKFKKNLTIKQLERFAEIISWNIFQMDGLKFVIPMSCHHKTEVIPGDLTLFGELPDIVEKSECEGCKYNRPLKHNGRYVKIMDWSNAKAVKFVSILKI